MLAYFYQQSENLAFKFLKLVAPLLEYDYTPE